MYCGEKKLYLARMFKSKHIPEINATRSYVINDINSVTLNQKGL